MFLKGRCVNKVNIKYLRFTLRFNVCYNYKVENLNKSSNQDDALIIDGDIIKYKINKIANDSELEHLIDIGEQFVDENLVASVLLDFDKVNKISLKMRTRGVQFLKSSRIKKVAIFGCSQFVRTTVVFLINFVNKKNIRVFDNEKDSLAWLNS